MFFNTLLSPNIWFIFKKWVFDKELFVYLNQTVLKICTKMEIKIDQQKYDTKTQETYSKIWFW